MTSFPILLSCHLHQTVWVSSDDSTVKAGMNNLCINVHFMSIFFKGGAQSIGSSPLTWIAHMYATVSVISREIRNSQRKDLARYSGQCMRLRSWYWIPLYISEEIILITNRQTFEYERKLRTSSLRRQFYFFKIYTVQHRQENHTIISYFMKWEKNDTMM